MKHKGEAAPKRRKSVARATLEEILKEGITTSHEEFESFAGVIVERVARSPDQPSNWVVKGVRYGKADRHRCGLVLAHCVEQAQEEYDLSDADDH
jgi:hypothetical protein